MRISDPNTQSWLGFFGKWRMHNTTGVPLSHTVSHVDTAPSFYCLSDRLLITYHGPALLWHESYTRAALFLSLFADFKQRGNEDEALSQHLLLSVFLSSSSFITEFLLLPCPPPTPHPASTIQPFTSYLLIVLPVCFCYPQFSTPTWLFYIIVLCVYPGREKGAANIVV